MTDIANTNEQPRSDGPQRTDEESESRNTEPTAALRARRFQLQTELADLTDRYVAAIHTAEQDADLVDVEDIHSQITRVKNELADLNEVMGDTA